MAAWVRPFTSLYPLHFPPFFSLGFQTPQAMAATYFGSIFMSALQLCQDEDGEEEAGEAKW